MLVGHAHLSIRVPIEKPKLAFGRNTVKPKFPVKEMN